MPITPNMLAASWRVALARGHDALTAGARCPSEPLDAVELHRHASVLIRERDQVARLLSRRVELPTATRANLGLPNEIDACVFDLDGALTASSDLHATAWADAFDAFLTERFEGASVHLSHYLRFSRADDYQELVQGKPRLQGARDLLASRGLTLPEGSPDDAPSTQTVHGLANAKRDALRRRLAREGVAAYDGAGAYLQTVAAAGLACAVVSASGHTSEILQRAGLADLVDAYVDAEAMAREGLEPPPAPDTLLAACGLLGIAPRRAAAFETTRAGIEAAENAGMGAVRCGFPRSEQRHSRGNVAR